MMDNILILSNNVMHYDWGTLNYIRNHFGYSSSLVNQPIAEVWIGAHPVLPSYAKVDGVSEDLDTVIAEDTQTCIGKHASSHSKELPFLLKILSAKKPLSLQVHPNKKQAEEGFLAENKQGIALDAIGRCYKDDNHKPELIYAITEFTAMCGFREKQEIEQLFNDYSISDIIIDIAGKDWGVESLFKALLYADENQRKSLIERVIAEASSKRGDVATIINTLYENYPTDIGVVSPLLLRCFTLNAGDSLYLDAGVVHSYVKGTGIEIMAASDNVLRAGLTLKHIDKDELMKITNFSSELPQILRSFEAHQIDKEYMYPVPVDDFTFSVVRLSANDTYESESYKEAAGLTGNNAATILLCIGGEATIVETENDKSLTLAKGESCFIKAGCKQYKVTGNTTFVKASYINKTKTQ